MSFEIALIGTMVVVVVVSGVVWWRHKKKDVCADIYDGATDAMVEEMKKEIDRQILDEIYRQADKDRARWGDKKWRKDEHQYPSAWRGQ